MVPEGVRVVSALHTVSAAKLSDLEHELDEDVLIAGDDREAKRARGRAGRSASPGCGRWTAGKLEMARMIEGLTRC